MLVLEVKDSYFRKKVAYNKQLVYSHRVVVEVRTYLLLAKMGRDGNGEWEHGSDPSDPAWLADNLLTTHNPCSCWCWCVKCTGGVYIVHFT